MGSDEIHGPEESSKFIFQLGLFLGPVFHTCLILR